MCFLQTVPKETLFFVTWYLAQLRKQIRKNLIECISVKCALKLISSLVFHTPYCSYGATLLYVRRISQEGGRSKLQSPHIVFEGLGKYYEWYAAAGGLRTLRQVLPLPWSLVAALACEVATGQSIPISWTAALEVLPDL